MATTTARGIPEAYFVDDDVEAFMRNGMAEGRSPRKFANIAELQAFTNEVHDAGGFFFPFFSTTNQRRNPLNPNPTGHQLYQKYKFIESNLQREQQMYVRALLSSLQDFN